MLDESIWCLVYFVAFIFLFFFFLWKMLFGNNADLDQTQHYVASDLSLHCLLMTPLGVSS